MMSQLKTISRRDWIHLCAGLIIAIGIYALNQQQTWAQSLKNCQITMRKATPSSCAEEHNCEWGGMRTSWKSSQSSCNLE